MNSLLLLISFCFVFLNPGRKSRNFKKYKKERQAGETAKPGDHQPKQEAHQEMR